MEQFALSFAAWLKPYIHNIAMMILATLLVIYGNDVNAFVRKQVANASFIVRTIIFVLVCAFGYGLLLVALTPVVASALAKIPSIYLGFVVVGIFLLLGWLAERKKQM